MLEAVDGVLQLAIQNDAVCNDDNGIENGVVAFVVQRCQTISKPCNGIGLAAAR